MIIPILYSLFLHFLTLNAARHGLHGEDMTSTIPDEHLPSLLQQIPMYDVLNTIDIEGKHIVSLYSRRGYDSSSISRSTCMAIGSKFAIPTKNNSISSTSNILSSIDPRNGIIKYELDSPLAIDINLQHCYNAGIYAYFEICFMNIFAFLVPMILLTKQKAICYLHDNIPMTQGKPILVDLLQMKTKNKMHIFFLDAILNGLCSKRYFHFIDNRIQRPLNSYDLTNPNVMKLESGIEINNENILPITNHSSCVIHISNTPIKTLNHPIEIREQVFSMLQQEGVKLLNLDYKKLYPITNPKLNVMKNIIVYNRNDAFNYRRLLNSNEIVKKLSKVFNNYNVIELHAIPHNISDIIPLFSQAHVFIGPHGGWIPNIVFAPKDAIIMILQNSLMKPAFNVWDITFRTNVLNVIDVRPYDTRHIESKEVQEEDGALYCKLEYDGMIVLKSNVTISDISCISNYLSKYLDMSTKTFSQSQISSIAISIANAANKHQVVHFGVEESTCKFFDYLSNKSITIV